MTPAPRAPESVRRSGRRGAHRGRRLLATLAILAILPLPWRAAPPSSGPGTAWRVDGRLEIDGTTIDPPGHVLWLAAGRPQLLWERIREATTGRAPATPLTHGDPSTTPATAVPAAVAVALAAAGQPTAPAADASLGLWVGPVDLGRLAADLRLGDSHGLALAVLVLRHLGAVDLGTTTVAATGRLAADGRVLPVGGVTPKVRAAVRAGAVTVLVPRGQEDEARVAAGSADVTVRGVAELSDLLVG